MEPKTNSLHDKRISAGASLRALAELMGISAPYLLDLERGARPLNPALARKHRLALTKVNRPVRPHLLKVAHFVKKHPHELENNEWKVKWPVEHENGKTYNPDFYEPSSGYFIEVVTSWPNHSSDQFKWASAIVQGYKLRVYWWTGEDITSDIVEGRTASEIRNKHGLPRK